MADKESKNLPKQLRIAIEGSRAGIVLENAYLPNALTDEGKIDRDSVLRAGRLPEEFSRFVLIADGKEVAFLTRGEKQWSAHYLDGNGNEESKKPYDRTETKRGRRKDSKLPPSIDPGSDLLQVVTKVAKEIWPDMAVTTRTGGARVSSYKKQSSEREQKIIELVEKMAGLMNLSVEEVAKMQDVTLPEGYLKALHADEQEEAEVMENIVSEPEPTGKKSK